MAYRSGRSSIRHAPTDVGSVMMVFAAVWGFVLLVYCLIMLVRGGGGGSDAVKDSSNGGLSRIQLTLKDFERRIKKLEAARVNAPPPFVRRARPIVLDPEGQPGVRSHGDGGAAEKTLAGQDAGQDASVTDSSNSVFPLVDPTVLTREDPGWQGDMKKLCEHRPDGDEDMLQRTRVWSGAQMGSPRILCISYTLSKAHDTAIKSIRQTWGKKCDGYLAMSDVTDPSIPSVDIKHEGPEAYDNMWQKIRSIWLYVHKHHVNEYDYFLIGGDDLYVLVENVRLYLLSDEVARLTEHGTKPVFLGRRFLPPGEKVVFNSGGASYILNRPALNVLAEGLKGTRCRPHQKGFWEDVNTAYCLSLAGVTAQDTRDSLGRERFLPFTPGHHLHYRIPQNPDWYAKYTLDLKTGYNCCSEEAITFHYVKGDLMRRYHALLYGMCQKV